MNLVIFLKSYFKNHSLFSACLRTLTSLVNELMMCICSRVLSSAVMRALAAFPRELLSYVVS